MITGYSFKSDPCILNDGATIAVVGGGPAGSFFSILALREARKRGLHLNIALFDGKNFLNEGPRGCNMCAGVISKDLLWELERLGLQIPGDRVQRRIDNYIFHTINGNHIVSAPTGKGSLPVVFRGNGPRFSGEIGRISFDDYLLDQAVQNGATIVPSFVKDIVPPGPSTALPAVCWPDGSLSADLVVVAAGVSTEFAKKIRSYGIGYQPPRCVRAFQAELDLGERSLEKHFGNSIHVFSIGLKGIRFAAIIPKSRFATVSLVGDQDLDKRHLTAFLSSPIVKNLLPVNWQLPDRFCFCRPSLPVSGGKGFFGDRLLIIGDAAMSRHYKNGIDSAFRTARFAATAIFKQGLSSKTLKRTYATPVMKEFRAENICARILFSLNDYISHRRFWVNAHLYYVLRRPGSKTARSIFFLTWNLFTGQASYRRIFRTALSPSFILGMTLGILRRRKALDRKKSSQP